MITILSIDGGGIRGIIPAAILAELEQRTGKPVCRLFDYIAGTSTGGIITAMLTVPDSSGQPKYSAGEVKSLYTELGRKVFHRSIMRRIVTLGSLSGPRYSVKNLERLLQEYLGNTRLHSTLTNVIVPTYDMENCTPWFFKTSYAAERASREEDPLLAQVARATSAAPTYFRPMRMAPRHCFIDGGVFANNPAVCAYAEARKNHPFERDFLIVSLGTGQHQKRHSYRQAKNWGTLCWTLPILGVIMNSASSTVDYQMQTLVGSDNYFRFQVRLDRRSTDMDDAGEENLRRLDRLAKEEIKRSRGKIDHLCRILNSAGPP